MQPLISLFTPCLGDKLGQEWPLKAAAIWWLQNPFKICCLKAGGNPARHKPGLFQAWGYGQFNGPGASSLGTAAHRLLTLTRVLCGISHLSLLSPSAILQARNKAKRDDFCNTAGIANMFVLLEWFSSTRGDQWSCWKTSCKKWRLTLLLFWQRWISKYDLEPCLNFKLTKSLKFHNICSIFFSIIFQLLSSLNHLITIISTLNVPWLLKDEVRAIMSNQQLINSREN